MVSYNPGPNNLIPPSPGGLNATELEMLAQVQVTVNRHILQWRSEVVLSERDRMEFEIDTGDLPLDIYAITLELERDEVTQGIPVMWNTRRANNKVSTRDWQQRMQEEQYAGDCSITLLYRGLPVPGFTANILFQVSRLAEQHYAYMREVLREQNEKVLYSNRGRTHEIAVLTTGKTPGGVRYEVVRAHFERMQDLLTPILDNPHRELRRMITYQPSNTIRSLSYSSMQLAARSGAGWNPIPASDNFPAAEVVSEPPVSEAARVLRIPPRSPVAAWQEKLKKIQERYKASDRPAAHYLRALPSRLPVPKLEESFNTYENRFLKMTISKLVDATRLVEKQLGEEISAAERDQERSSRTRAANYEALIAANRRYILNLKKMRLRLEEIIKNSFLATLGAPGGKRPSVVLRENRYYRQIRLIEAALEKDLNLSASTVGLEKPDRGLRLSSVNRLYEYYVTVVVLMTMVEKLGFTVIAKEGRPVSLNNLVPSKTQFNYILNSGGSMELLSPTGKRVVVYYDREYPAREEHPFNAVYYGYFAPLGYGSTKRRPDIAIEVFTEDERVPRIVVLDATYSRDSRNLYLKYQYRDSIRDFTRIDTQSGTPARPVVASWVIYPEMPNKLDHDEFRFGQLPLQPGPQAHDQLAGILRRLLVMASALD